VQEEPAIESNVPELASPSPSGNRPTKLLQWAATLAAILIAWGLGAWLRLDWVSHAEKQPAFQWQGHYLPTTHDSYLYTSIIHQASNTNALEEELKSHPGPMEHGAITLLGTALVRHGGFHVADVITYLPVFMAGLLAVPMVLLGRLYGSTIAGCCSACLAVVAFSYFNRTNAGYFDTDMFSVTVPALILYFLMCAHREESLPWLVAGAFGIFIYPFFYNAGVPIVTALGMSFIGFRMLIWLAGLLFKKKKPPAKSIDFTLGAIPLICIAIIHCSTTTGINWVNNLEKPLIALAWLIASAIGLALLMTHILPARFQVTIRPSHSRYALISIGIVCLVWMVGFSSSFDRIRTATIGYLPGVKARLQSGKPQGEAQQNPIIYKNVIETIIEARKSPWSELMERISGSSWGCMLALLGYLFLVFLYPELLIAIPFIGIGVFAHWGGHRFTIHAVPIGALSAVFLPLCLLESVRRFKKWNKEKAPADCSWPNKPREYFSQFGNWIFAVGGVRIVTPILALALIWPNIQIAKARSAILPTVLQQAEVQLLDDLHKASKPGDYVHTWWDWGTAVWCHAERNVLTHPGNQSTDTFICAKMLMTDSPRLSAHLGRTAVEYYHHDDSSGLAVNHIFGKENQTPSETLKSLEAHLPVQPTRDIFMYLPYRLLKFYHVLHMFSERDLSTGEEMPFPQFATFQSWQRQGDAIQILGPDRDGRAVLYYLIDPAQLTLTHMRRGKTPMQVRATSRSGQNPFPNAGVITLQLKNNQLLHAKQIQIKPEGFDLTALNDKTGFVPLGEVRVMYPARLVKKIEQPNIQESHAAKGDAANQPGLHIICSQNPPIAVLADEAAYKSQLVQMLILGRADPEYFEQISANEAGRVFKLKK
jgi:undecaprenyl-diphosphooligosaccharide--protein glycosyltransferase